MQKCRGLFFPTNPVLYDRLDCVADFRGQDFCSSTVVDFDISSCRYIYVDNFRYLPVY